jgi:hypothetical protein
VERRTRQLFLLFFLIESDASNLGEFSLLVLFSRSKGLVS